MASSSARPILRPASAIPEKPGHPEVVAAVEDADQPHLAPRQAGGHPDARPTASRERCIELGTTFTAVGVDASILARTSEKLVASFRPA